MTTTATFETLVNETIQSLSLVTGTSVQLYAEDRIASYVQQAFDFVFDEIWWPKYMQYYNRTLDGTLGVTTQSLSTIKRFEDIRHIFIDGRRVPLPVLPGELNPFELTGSTPLYYAEYEDDTRVVQFWPKTSTGTIYINARVKPDEFTAQDIPRMDKTLLVNAAAWDYASDDGTNPGAVQKFQQKFERRLQQIRSNQSNKPVEADPRFRDYPLDWFERTP